MKKFVKLACMSLLMVVLSACQPSTEATKLVATDITGADFEQNMHLTDHTGAKRTMADYQGKVVALFFGYTNCPDVCPTTMHELKQTMQLLGEQANEVQVLFVTLDPERDTQEVLAQFVPSFDQRFVGLTGSVQEIAATAKMFKIFSSKVATEGRSGYTIDHSAGMYVYDKQGKIRLYVEYGQKPADLASDIKTLL
jgi:protein SCO1/2